MSTAHHGFKDCECYGRWGGGVTGYCSVCDLALPGVVCIVFFLGKQERDKAKPVYLYFSLLPTTTRPFY